MEIRKLFLNRFGRLRSGWRFLVFLALFTGINFALVTVVRIAYASLNGTVPALPHAEYFTDLIFRLTLLLSALIAGYVCIRYLEGLPWRSLGLTFHRGWFRDLLLGSAVGIISLGIAAGIAAAGGGITFGTNGPGMLTAVGATLVSTAILFVIAALAEEALFRGYPLQTFCRAHLPWLGILITSVGFGSVHLANPNAGAILAFVNTSLAGIWLGVAYLRTRSLWLPLGVHWAWNWALGSLFGLPVSGVSIVSNPLLIGKDLGPAWLTGGAYGIEGGVACTISLILSTLFLWRIKWLSATPEMSKLTSEENPTRAADVVPAIESN